VDDDVYVYADDDMIMDDMISMDAMINLDDMINLDAVNRHDLKDDLKENISSLKSQIHGPVKTIEIIASIQEICKLGLSKSGFQQSLVIKDDCDSLKVKVSESLIHTKLGIDGETARNIRKTHAGTGELVNLLADWYKWLENLKDFKFILEIGQGGVEWIG
jgi:hypothetical protein